MQNGAVIKFDRQPVPRYHVEPPTQESAALNNLRAYRYAHLSKADNIRLLHLLPSHDESDRINCHLVEYPLLPSTQRMHLYEALSYSWGSSPSCRNIFIDGCALGVTETLHETLMCLRDSVVSRVLWVDADEKQKQIPLMASIYSKASRVIVWLGKAEVGDDRVFQPICDAAESTAGEDLVVDDGV